MKLGTVSMRVALVLRSVEVQPLFRGLCKNAFIFLCEKDYSSRFASLTPCHTASTFPQLQSTVGHITKTRTKHAIPISTEKERTKSGLCPSSLPSIKKQLNNQPNNFKLNNTFPCFWFFMDSLSG